MAGRTIGISRDRLIGNDGMEERVRIVNHAERDLTFAVELELGCDAADIFEVRGYPRPERGTLLPVALTATRATFRYDGLDGMRRSTHVAFSTAAEAFGPIDGRSDDAIAQGGSVRFRWDVRLAPGERRDLQLDDLVDDGQGRGGPGVRRRAGPGERAGAGRLRGRLGGARPGRPPCSRSRPRSAPTTGRRPTTPGAAARPRSRPTTSCST